MAEKSPSPDDTETCKGYTIPSNEEVINELTKDLHSACINAAEKNSSIDNECNRRKSDQTAYNVGTNEEEDETKVTPGCSGKESENEERHVRDEDFIDEEAMKEQENTYTEEDKEVFNICTYKLGSEVRLHYRECLFTPRTQNFKLCLHVIHTVRLLIIIKNCRS
jgi:hypothetical protein